MPANPLIQIDEIQALAIERGGKCLSTSYDKKNQKLVWECKNRHQWEATLGNVKYHETWCKKCKTRNLYESMTRDILVKLFDKPFESSRSSLKSLLELDCYNEELKLAVEYNGKQHYEFSPLFHRTMNQFHVQQERDERKRKECKDLEITLIEVHYKINTYSKIRIYLIDILTNTKYVSLMNLDQEWSSFFSGHDRSLADKELKKITQKATERGGSLVSTSYGGSYQKLEFKCKEDDHPTFFMQPNNMIAGQWCPYCNPIRPKEYGYYKDIVENMFNGTFYKNYKHNFTSDKGRRQCHHYVEFACANGHDHKILTGNLKRHIDKGVFKCYKCK